MSGSDDRAPLPRAVDVFLGHAPVDGLAEGVHRLATATHHRLGGSIGQLAGLVGHPVHPVLTDLPIGFWTSAWVLDLVGGREARPAARQLVGAGVLCAVPTAVSGLHDAGAEDHGLDRRVVAVHASCNVAALAAYAWSWWARRHDRWRQGVALGMVGAALATAGGMLGGELAFGGALRRDEVEQVDLIEERGTAGPR